MTYKTAWRICHEIRKQMDNGEVKQLLRGHVETGEANFGVKRSGVKRGRGPPGKTIVMACSQQRGRLAASITPDVKLATLWAETIAQVAPGATIPIDELASYASLARAGHTCCGRTRKEWAVFDDQTQALHHTDGVGNF